MKIEIDALSGTPIYQQVIRGIKELIDGGTLSAGDLLPSMNALSAELGISKETVKKSYNLLSDMGYIAPAHGKGFFVCDLGGGRRERVLMLFDKLSTYKLLLFRSFSEALGDRADITIHVHNQDVGAFRSLLESSLDSYDHYIITPHFPLDLPTQKEVLGLLKKVPSRKLIILDRDMQGLKGNYGAVYQDFGNDTYEALAQSLPLLRKYRKINTLITKGSLYHELIREGMSRFFEEHRLDHSFIRDAGAVKLGRGEVYIVMGGQLDTEMFDILRAAEKEGLKIGKDIGIVSFNDSPINEFILGGLTTFSTDFSEMGRLAAGMILDRRTSRIHNKFALIQRGTL